MQCPETEILAELLADGSSTETSEAFWKHLETCSRCREELDRISDDTELRHWRDESSTSKGDIVESDAIDQLVVQLTDRDTAVDSIVSRTTTEEHELDKFVLDSLEPSEDPSDLGKLGQFRIQRVLGHGGMAVVFEAIDTELNRIVALKVLRSSQSDPSSLERFVREARALAGIQNPNVVSIYSVQSHEARVPLIAMEMIYGGSLQDKLRLQSDIEPRLAASWIAEAANGLAAAHDAGLIHRDIKPSNILIATNGSHSAAKLADFGLARFTAVEHHATQTGVLLGTPAYMSPEQVATPESCSAGSDIYSLGVTLYELLTGEVPFRGAVHTVLQRIGRDDPTPPRLLNSLVPIDLETICMKAMQRDPSRRYLSAHAFEDDLRRWLNGQPILARPATKLDHFKGWCRRNPWVASLTGTIASLLIVLAITSTYFAMTIQAARENLRKEKEVVEATSKQLQISAEDAKKQRKIAIDSLNNLVTKVQSELKQRPGTLKLRESILDVALSGLDQITRDSNATVIDLTTVLAYIQKGDIYDSLGRSDASLGELEKATALAEKYNSQLPNQPEVEKVLGDALLAQADVATRRGANEIALSLYKRVLPIREAAFSALPPNIADSTTFDARKAYLLVLGRLGDIHYHRGGWGESHAYLDRALQLASVNAAKFSESPIAKRDLSLAHQRMGSIELLRDRNDEASKHFLEAVELNRALLAADPGNKLYSGDLGYMLGELAKLTNAKGDSETAIAQAKESIQQCEKVVAADPEDTDAKLKAAMSWNQLYWIFLVENRLPLAEKAVNKFLELNEKLIEQNPTSSKFPSLSAGWLEKLADLQIRQGKLAEIPATSRRLIENLKRCQKCADAIPALFQPMIAMTEKLERGFQLILSGIDMINEIATEDAEVLYAGRLYSMYEAARTGKVESAISMGQKLSTTSPSNALSASVGPIVMARALSLCYQSISKGGDSDSSDAMKKKQLVLEMAVEQLKGWLASPAMVANPTLRSFILKDIDFHPIREQALFKELLK